MNYEEFLESKKKEKITKGIEISVNDLNPVLFDYQKEIVRIALLNKRYCLFESCGMGKTLQQLEWAYQVNKVIKKPILILAPLGVTTQTAKEEAPKLGYEVNMIVYNDMKITDGINIINYEQVENIDTSVFGGVILDESSILKNFTGKVRTRLTNAFKDTEYKLCCTATPAPNDLMELLNHADFLGIMSTPQALANYFVYDMQTGDYRLKGHATKDFYKWCCDWCINIESPQDLGYKADYYVLPKLTEKEVIIPISEIADDFENGMFRDIGTSATSFHKEKKHTAEIRAKKCAEICMQDDEQYIIWCDTNYESSLLKKAIPDAIEVRGSDKPKYKEDKAMEFKRGEIRVLISKPKIFGYGMNFQKCHNVIFCGLTYSYENYYQALRRIYRFGQEHEVFSYIVLGSTELHILDTINRKKETQIELKNQMDMSTKEIQLLKFKGEREVKEFHFDKIEIPKFL